MRPYPLTYLCIRVDRTELEARDVVAFAESLAIPEDAVQPFLEATAELANLADRLADEPLPGSWLRIATAASRMVGAVPRHPVTRTEGEP